MKVIKYISTVLLIASISLSAQAQVVKKTKAGEKEKQKSEQVSERMQARFEEKKASDSDIQWQRIIYRSLNLNVVENMPLYYPEEPCAEGMNLFFIIIKNISNGSLPAYEYLDGKEIFSDEYRINVKDMFDRFHILYANAKGSTEKNPKYTIEYADIPANEVLSYYIREKYEFNRLNSKVTRKVEAVCPVLHRNDDFGGDAIKYPMFWVKIEDLRPFIINQYVFTDNDNNLLKTSLDDFFTGNMYKGEIYKYKNLRNLSMMQMYPDSTKLKHAQDSIEKRLSSFDANIWVPTREELQARNKAQNEKQDTAKTSSESERVKTDGDDNKKETVVNESAPKSKRAEKSVKKNSKVKKSSTKVKKSNSGATRSVRRRR